MEPVIGRLSYQGAGFRWVVGLFMSSRSLSSTGFMSQ